MRDLAQVCQELKACLVQVSTDYVFDGKKKTPYTKEDPPNPLNVYGLSKLMGEYFTRMFAERHLIVRSAGLYGKAKSNLKKIINTYYRPNGEEGEKEVSKFLKMISTYKNKIRKIKHKIKQEEKMK